VGDAAARLRPTGDRRVYERDAYRPDEIELGPATPAVIFQTERGSANALEEISPADCAHRIGVGNAMAKEVRRIELMNQVLDLVSGRGAPDAERATASLTAAARCYVLRVADGATLADVLRRQNAPALARAAGGRARAHA
jgi:hypothetical protein